MPHARHLSNNSKIYQSFKDMEQQLSREISQLKHCVAHSRTKFTQPEKSNVMVRPYQPRDLYLAQTMLGPRLAYSGVERDKDFSSVVQQRLLEHPREKTEQYYSWDFESRISHSSAPDTYTPKLEVAVTVAAKRNIRKARIIVKMGFRLIRRHIMWFELNVRHNARHWASLPWLMCSFTTVNVRANDAPIFQACFDWNLESVRFLLETGRASVYDVDEETGRGLLEVCIVLYTVPARYNHITK
jgi:hypothetical protein